MKILLSCFFIFISIGLELKAQQIYLFHINTGKPCTDVDVYYLYFGINNKLVVRPAKANLIDLNSIAIKSDSARIEKVNDSLYYCQPIYKDVSLKIYVINTLTDGKIDSIRSYSIGQPFSFSINGKNHPVSYSNVIITDMKYLFFTPMRQGCLDYEKGFRIVAYQLVLMRNDATVLAANFKKGQLIKNSFKKKLKQLSKPGDGLFAKNIIIERKEDGRKITIYEYGLLEIQ